MAVPVRQRPTRRQLEVLRAYNRAGSVAAAAFELGISETTVRQHPSGLYRRTGFVDTAQAAYWLGTMHRDSDVTPGVASQPRGSQKAVDADPPSTAMSDLPAAAQR